MSDNTQASFDVVEFLRREAHSDTVPWKAAQFESCAKFVERLLEENRARRLNPIVHLDSPAAAPPQGAGPEGPEWIEEFGREVGVGDNAQAAWVRLMDRMPEGTVRNARFAVVWLAARRPSPTEGSAAQVTRFEVIDHRSMGEGEAHGALRGRVYYAMPCRVELSYQDQGRTLKVFVDDPAPPTPRTER